MNLVNKTTFQNQIEAHRNIPDKAEYDLVPHIYD